MTFTESTVAHFSSQENICCVPGTKKRSKQFWRIILARCSKRKGSTFEKYNIKLYLMLHSRIQKWILLAYVSPLPTSSISNTRRVLENGRKIWCLFFSTRSFLLHIPSVQEVLTLSTKPFTRFNILPTKIRCKKVHSYELKCIKRRWKTGQDEERSEHIL